MGSDDIFVHIPHGQIRKPEWRKEFEDNILGIFSTTQTVKTFYSQETETEKKKKTYLEGLGGGASDFFFIWPASPRSAGAAGVTSSSMLRSIESWMVTLHTDRQEGCRTV